MQRVARFQMAIQASVPIVRDVPAIVKPKLSRLPALSKEPRRVGFVLLWALIPYRVGQGSDRRRRSDIRLIKRSDRFNGASEHCAQNPRRKREQNEPGGSAEQPLYCRRIPLLASI
jgi:hypothetical protein